MAAHNPNGAEPAGTAGRDEGYLYWPAWLGHNGNTRLLGRRRQRLLPPHLLHARLRSAAQHRQVRGAGSAEPGRCRPSPASPTRCSPPLPPDLVEPEMQKQAPSIGRILIAVGFTLSCFGLILFLWIAFGGPIPLKPQSYRITAYFPEATQLALESDVRIGGVSVGKVKSIDARAAGQARQRQGHHRGGDRDRAASSRRSPTDARAILRQKTLLGETYVELTSGTSPDEHAAPVSLGAAANVSDAESESVDSRSPRAARSGSAAPRRRPRSTRSSTPSTSRRAPRSSAGSRTRRSRSTAAASTSTTRSATSAPSSPTPPTSSTCSAARRRR